MTLMNFANVKWSNLLPLLTFASSAVSSNQVPEQSEEIRRAEKDLFNEMMWSHPEVFSSELHAHYAMYAGHGRL